MYENKNLFLSFFDLNSALIRDPAYKLFQLIVEQCLLLLATTNYVIVLVSLIRF